MRIKTEWTKSPEECLHSEGDAIETRTYCSICGEEFDGEMSPWFAFFIGGVTILGILLLGIFIGNVF